MATGVLDGLIYVAGGIGSGGALGTLEVLDPRTNTWTDRAPMPTPRYGLAGAVAGGKFYAIGGLFPGTVPETFGTVEAYDPGTGTWSTKAPMPTPRAGMTAQVLEGNIYVAGGLRTTGSEGVEMLATLEAYDPKTDTWTSKTPTPTAGTASVSGVLGGRMYMVGLFPNFPAYAYDPASDSWESVPPVPTKRTGAAGAVIDDTLYAVGGLSNSSPDVLAANEAFSPFLTVAIDIKPGDPNNVINLKSSGIVPVAILSSSSFDATTVDPTTVTLAGAPVALRGNGKPMASVADVNHDGFPDLLVYFRTQKLQLTPADTEAVLYGKTYSGQAIRGSDKVKVIAPPARQTVAGGHQ